MVQVGLFDAPKAILGASPVSSTTAPLPRGGDGDGNAGVEGEVQLDNALHEDQTLPENAAEETSDVAMLALLQSEREVVDSKACCDLWEKDEWAIMGEICTCGQSCERV